MATRESIAEDLGVKQPDCIQEPHSAIMLLRMMQSNALRLETQICETRCALLYLPLLYMLKALSYTLSPHALL